MFSGTRRLSQDPAGHPVGTSSLVAMRRMDQQKDGHGCGRFIHPGQL